LKPPATFTGPRTKLDMWHPTGAPRRRLALGDYAGDHDGLDDGPIDLAIVAPSPAEASRDWLERAIALAAGKLGSDGVLWILVPRRWRGIAERALRRCDLVQLEPVIAVPRWPDSDHLIPLARAVLFDAGRRHLGLSRVVAWMLGLLVTTRAGRRLLSRVAPGCALLAARERALPTFRWLGDLDRAAAVTASVSSGPRRDARVAVALRFRPHSREPDLVVKAALDEAGVERVQAERDALERFGVTAARSGATVPVPGPGSCRWLLATNLLSGRQAGTVLARSPRRLLPIASVVADWLLRWNLATACHVPATAELLERLLLGPAARLVAAGVAPEPYAGALRTLAARLERHRLVRVTAHGDLTMVNVLVPYRALGVVDWESATASGLPLEDLWYSLADGVARAHRITRAAAVAALATDTEPASPALARLPAHHAETLQLSVDETLLAFHACWLGHADNELRRGDTVLQYCDVVRAVAALRLLWP
jgi:hypothetical protein